MINSSYVLPISSTINEGGGRGRKKEKKKEGRREGRKRRGKSVEEEREGKIRELVTDIL